MKNKAISHVITFPESSILPQRPRNSPKSRSMQHTFDVPGNSWVPGSDRWFSDCIHVLNRFIIHLTPVLSKNLINDDEVAIRKKITLFSLSGIPWNREKNVFFRIFKEKDCKNILRPKRDIPGVSFEGVVMSSSLKSLFLQLFSNCPNIRFTIIGAIQLYQENCK